jgi:DNA-binding MarR family transcriptional regulator
MDTLSAYICFNMRAAMKKIDRLFGGKLDEVGISIPQSFILSCLYEENGLTLKEIGSRTLIDSSSMTVLVDKLEKDQLVKRQLDSKDRRAIRVFITDTGMEMAEKIHTVILNLNTLLFDLLGEGNQKEFIHGLNNIVNGIED